MYSRTPVTRSNSERTRKTVRVSRGSSYRGRLNLQFAMFKAEKKLQQNASLKNSHRNHTNRVFYQQVSLPTNLTRWWFSVTVKLKWVRWLKTVLAVCVHMSFAKSWQEKGCSSQADTWKLKNILMKDFDWQIKCDICGVAMATWTIEYNLKISLFHSLHKIRSLDFPINLHTAYYN